MIDLAPLKEQLQGKKVAIVGLGKSGMPVFDACRAAGIDTILWDDNIAARKAAEDAGGTVRNPSLEDLKSCAFMCLSPGIPLTHPLPHPLVDLAKQARIEIIGDVEMFHRAKPNVRTIAITGTNGKSTTTALLGHILKTAKVPSAVGGNIGQAVLSLPDLPQGSTYVLELSSYQIDLLSKFRPDINILLNFSPDHLDRHGNMTGYVAVKEKMFGAPASGNTGVAIIGMDDEWSAGVYDRVKKAGARKMIPVSYLRPMMKGVFVSTEGMLFDGDKKVINLNTCPALRGTHNWQNAAMAYAAAREAGVDAKTIISALQNFPGLVHRQNIITAINGVTYINDSKATNDDAASMALRTYTHIYWIAGGKPKDGGYANCERYLGHVQHTFLIGQAEESMAMWLASQDAPFTRCGNLAVATVAAHRMAQKEKLARAVVLLSPACASFDQFKSFEERGEAFADLVMRLTRKKQFRDAQKQTEKQPEEKS